MQSDIFGSDKGLRDETSAICLQRTTWRIHGRKQLWGKLLNSNRIKKALKNACNSPLGLSLPWHQVFHLFLVVPGSKQHPCLLKHFYSNRNSAEVVRVCVCVSSITQHIWCTHQCYRQSAGISCLQINHLSSPFSRDSFVTPQTSRTLTSAKEEHSVYVCV